MCSAKKGKWTLVDLETHHHLYQKIVDLFEQKRRRIIEEGSDENCDALYLRHNGKTFTVHKNKLFSLNYSDVEQHKYVQSKRKGERNGKQKRARSVKKENVKDIYFRAVNDYPNIDLKFDYNEDENGDEIEWDNDMVKDVLKKHVLKMHHYKTSAERGSEAEPGELFGVGPIVENLLDLDLFENPLKYMAKKCQYVLKGIDGTYYLIGDYFSFSASHVEDESLCSINLMLIGLAYWCIVDSRDNELFYQSLAADTGEDCPALLHGKRYFISPAWLEHHSIRYTWVIQRPGDVIVLKSGVIHTVVNVSKLSIKQACNFVLHDQIEEMSKRVACECSREGIEQINMPTSFKFKHGQSIKYCMDDVRKWTIRFLNEFKINIFLHNENSIKTTSDITATLCELFECVFNENFKGSLNMEKLFRSIQDCATENDYASTNRNKFECSVCSKTFMWKQSLAKHMQNHSDIKKFKCELCDESFLTYNKLSYHEEKMHSVPSEHKCNYCEYVANKKNSLYKHTQSKHKDKVQVDKLSEL